MTYEQRLTALAELLPAKVIELIKACRHANDTRQFLSDQYDKAYGNAIEGCMNPLFVSDEGTKNIESIAQRIETRMYAAFYDWLFAYDD